MSTRKYLISAAAAALMAGSAAALGVAQGDASGGVAGPTALPGTPIAAAVVVAEEATLAATGSDMQMFEITISSTGTFAASENYFVDLTVSGGTFAEALTGAEVTNGSGGAPVTISGSSVQAIGAGVPQDGQIGDTSVRYLVSNSPSAGDNFGIEVPVTYSGCPADLTFTVSVQTSGGVIFEEGTATLAAPAITCGNAYLGTIATDVVAGANDSVLASPAFATFLTTVTRSATDELATGTPVAGGLDTGTTGALGVITATFDPDGVATSFLTSLDSSTGPLTGAAAEVTSLDFDMSLPTPAGVLSADFQQVGEGAVAMTTGTGSFSDTITPVLTTDPHVENIVLTIDGTTLIAQQDVTTTNGVLNFGAALGIVASEAVADATLDDLNFEGVTCETFDWVGDASKPTQNIFRVTGHGSATTSVIATATNSSEGLDGSAALTEPYDFTDPEIVITASHLTDALGDFGRADISMNFIGGNSALDCDRLMNSDAANIITPFGNDDADPATDGDD